VEGNTNGVREGTTAHGWVKGDSNKKMPLCGAQNPAEMGQGKESRKKKRWRREEKVRKKRVGLGHGISKKKIGQKGQAPAWVRKTAVE